MRVRIINQTTQEFNGERYWLCGRYFQRKGRRLHRVVYEHHRGRLPTGRKHHLHHKDGNIHNNQIENLELRSASSHMSFHSKNSDHENWIQAMRDGAAKWHGSAAGREWHRKHYEKNCKDAFEKAKVHGACEICGGPFFGPKFKKYCSRKCQQKGWFLKSGRKKRVCLICKKSFLGSGQTCSKSCAMRSVWKKRKGGRGKK